MSQQVNPGRAAVMARLEEIQPRVREMHRDYYVRMGYQPDMFDSGFSVNPGGAKYIKLLKQNSVFCFIDAESGDIYKAASYKAPAKGARGNIFEDEDVQRCMENPNGGGFYR